MGKINSKKTSSQIREKFILTQFKNDLKKIIDSDKINKEAEQMGNKNIIVEQTNQKVKNFGGDRFIGILPERRKKINKLVQRTNSSNLQKKEIVIEKISRKSITKKKCRQSKKKEKKHSYLSAVSSNKWKSD